MSDDCDDVHVLEAQAMFVRGNVFHVDIPADERREGSRPRDPLANLREKPFDLNGRTLHEVQQEASRVRLGSVFKSFDEFDRCCESWGVMNHRAVARYKTSKEIRIRNCRYGLTPTTRRTSYSAKALVDRDSTSESEESDEQDENENGIYEDDDGPGFPSNEHQRGHSQLTYEENGPPRLALSQQQLEDLEFENGIRRMNQVNARQPLADLNPNKASGVNAGLSSQPIQPTQKRPRSLVRHTSEWLPGRHSLLPLPAGIKVRRKSRTGACGQLSRFQLLQPEDEPQGLLTTNLCPWYVRAYCKAKTGVISISKCNLRHTCPQNGHSWRGPMSKAKWLGETIAPVVVRHPKGPVKELRVGFQQDYKRSTNYHQMWRAKDLVRDAYLGGQRKSFHCIPGLIKRLKVVDPGCKAVWDSMDGSDVFYRAFVCPSACRKALQYCQPIICLDACHTKNRKYPTQLFLATVLDGNMEVLPLAFAIAPTENYENWRWFLDMLDCAIANIELVIVPFMSDRCKGLIAAVKDVFPGKLHGMCANHLRGNVKNTFGKGAESHFIHCVYANTAEIFNDILENLERSTAKGIAAAAYIRNLDPKLYARHAFPLPRFGHVTSNPCEATNSGLLPIREFAPFKLLVEMWFYVQKHFNSSRQKAAECQDFLTGPAHIRHQLNLRSYGQFQVFDDCGGKAKVQTTTGSEEYLVTLGEKPTCTCFELQEMCWPCEHIMAWDDMKGRPFSSRFHMCWRVVNWRKLYEGVVPSFLCNDIRPSNRCWPPEIAKKRGRHRYVRIRSGSRVSTAQRTGEDVETDSLGNLYLRYPIDDDSNLIDAMPTPGTVHANSAVGGEQRPSKRASRNAGKSKCTLCRRTGHNKRRCKSSAAAAADNSSAQDGIDNPSSEPQQEVDSTFPPGYEVNTPREQHNLAESGSATMDELVGLYRQIPGYAESESEGEDYDDDDEQYSQYARFGTTQDPQHPDWAPFLYKGNMAGISQVQDHLEAGLSNLR